MLLHEKADQAQALLAETGLDCWLTFARETELHPDPGIEQVVGAGVVRNSAFLFGAGGARVAIVANFDTSAIRAKGVFREVIGYDEDIRGPLLAALQRLDPRTIGLNYSLDDVTADGLTHGHWLLLQQLLSGTPYLDRLTSAAPLLARLRGRKSSTEVDRIRRAVAVTEQIVEQITSHIRPGLSERELAAFVHARFVEHGVSPAWPLEGCPIVNTGPASDLGHTYPSETVRIEPGHLVHIDLGVRIDGYCSDMQRMWYVRRPGESGPPEDVRRAFDTVVRAIDAGAEALRPGVRGFEVDAAARSVVVTGGYPEFKHGLGHGLGRAVHDGGTLLGPRWPCYGRNVEAAVEVGNVFTLELGIPTGSGVVGLEEDVLVTATGCEFLSSRQRELILV
ncbi:peptidase m24 : Peptidase M24 OS=Roseiflexus sp. (strain RS-1) GN=RoseRS_1789 PE=4 SV=1: Peptidase_M24 [Gemmata massiliana]|uniref:Peptidase M24 domain-containing protein n=1 Tax=Gemmata massiliana TaxID=1210884 RepID=A0A6P2D5J2_9BACT|nr:Xaa-Pro peptidase family protein [Gemmata massiliana]VTR94690.1 peptidase m24 : Peptidase M24 OS=Roseiflexus sp. (strain RS-1) GN=RoseRS_1789 PE=4 SV=1: Peptidase_M24 [Gemmata massiliana]